MGESIDEPRDAVILAKLRELVIRNATATLTSDPFSFFQVAIASELLLGRGGKEQVWQRIQERHGIASDYRSLFDSVWDEIRRLCQAGS